MGADHWYEKGDKIGGLGVAQKEGEESGVQVGSISQMSLFSISSVVNVVLLSFLTF